MVPHISDLLLGQPVYGANKRKGAGELTSMGVAGVASWRGARQHGRVKKRIDPEYMEER